MCFVLNLHEIILGMKIKALYTLSLILFFINIHAQDTESPCPPPDNKKAVKQFEKASDAYKAGNYTSAYQYLKIAVEEDPLYADANYMLALINLKKEKKNIKAAKFYLLETIRSCAEYEPYAYYYLADIFYGENKYDSCAKMIKVFLKDVDKIKSDKEYEYANQLLKFSQFYTDIYANPVPFEPKVVEGISTSLDEYLPIISPDNELALFTRKTKLEQQRTAFQQADVKFKEKFIVSQKQFDGSFDEGEPMPAPFNVQDNEGGATLTIDNRFIYYTVCKYTDGGNYYNCDICSSENKNGVWQPIKNLGRNVNTPNNWESQPTVSADGKTIYFVSDRKGGYGGYDIWITHKQDNGEWSVPENAGPNINSPGNEKTPFLHSDSQTLYFGSDGWLGLGGYDIFYMKLGKEKEWKQPKNIGYPINTPDDETGFFVSTDGKQGYFTSNKLKGKGGWDLYTFDLYEDARPEKVLFIKGELKDGKTDQPIPARIELKNMKTKQITNIPVDSTTGKYVAVVAFRNDYLMTIKKEDYAFESKYFSINDPHLSGAVTHNTEIKKIEVGESYQLKDINFATNSYDLTQESKNIIDGFIDFLKENPRVKVEIQGHTDDVGDDKANLILSDNRAKAVYEYMVIRNISPLRLSYKGYGETKPIANNQTEEGKAKNRRTVFVIKSK